MNIAYGESNSQFCWLGDPKTKFPYQRGDRESRERARQKMLAHREKLAAERSRLAGRELTEDELVRGIKHPDSRTLSQKMADDQWKPTPPPDDRSNLDRQIESLEAATSNEEDLAELAKMSTQERLLHWAKQQKAAEASKPKPKVHPPSADETKLEQLLHDKSWMPDVDEAELVKLRQAIAEFREGSPEVAQQLFQEIENAERGQIAQEQAAIAEQRHKLSELERSAAQRLARWEQEQQVVQRPSDQGSPVPAPEQPEEPTIKDQLREKFLAQPEVLQDHRRFWQAMDAEGDEAASEMLASIE